MAVLPPRSVHALPLPYKRLMTDTMSNIIEFYPADYETDMDGKRFLWQGVCKLPFIDERRLLKETREIEIELKDHEKDRNSSSSNRLFARKSTCQGQEIISTRRRACAGLKDDDDDSTSLELSMDGIRGRIRLMSLEQPNLGDDCVGESAEDVICVFLKTDENLEHIPRILEGVKFPIEIVSDGDIMETKLWHEHHGGSSSSSGNYRNRFQNVVRQKQPTTSRKANISSHTFVDEGAGTGFGMGRGKQSMPAPAAEHCNNLHKSVAPFRAARDLSSRTHAGRGQWSSSSNYGGSASDRSAYEDTGGRKQCERFEGLTVSNSRNSCSYHRNFRQSESWTSNKQTTVAAWRRRGSSNFPGQNQSTSTEAHYGYGRGRGWDSSRT